MLNRRMSGRGFYWSGWLQRAIMSLSEAVEKPHGHLCDGPRIVRVESAGFRRRGRHMGHADFREFLEVLSRSLKCVNIQREGECCLCDSALTVRFINGRFIFSVCFL